MERPALDADEMAILDYAKAWVKLAGANGFESALGELEMNRQVPWSQSLFEELTFDHFGDGRHPQITDPDEVQDLRVEAYRYDDGSGFAVDHDLPLDGKRSDFTVQFDFRKGETGYGSTWTTFTSYRRWIPSITTQFGSAIGCHGKCILRIGKSN